MESFYKNYSLQATKRKKILSMIQVLYNLADKIFALKIKEHKKITL
jgi:hypothetical protein